jgi:hypothetical protein
VTLPIAHEFAEPAPGSPELVSVTLGREVDRFDRNAAQRAEMARAARWTLVRVFFTAGLISFAALYSVAAVVEQGHSNIKTWMASHEPV